MAEKQTPKKKKKQTKQTSWPGAFKVFGQVFAQLKKNPVPAVVFLGMYAVLAVVSALSQPDVRYSSNDYRNYEDIVYLIFLLALPTYGLALADRKKISVGEFMQFSFKKYLAVFAAGVLYALIAGVSILLLIVPIVWTVAWYFVAAYPIVEKGMGPIAALKESKRLAESHKAKAWGVVGVTVLLSVAAALSSIILPVFGQVAVGFVTLLYYGAAAALYRWLQQNSSTA